MGCTFPDANDGISTRYPATETRKGSYFVPGLYSGHFRGTDCKNCTVNPNTCIGNVIGPHCSWSTYIDTHMYWNDSRAFVSSSCSRGNFGLYLNSATVDSSIMLVSRSCANHAQDLFNQQSRSTLIVSRNTWSFQSVSLQCT